jgi:DNA-binding CsgD family transcriptional regulator
MKTQRGPNANDVRAMLRLCRTLHISADPAARKKHLLAGLSALLDAASALSVVAHVERIPRRHTILSTARHGSPALREEQLLANCLPAADDLPQRSSPGAEARWNHVLWPRRPCPALRICHCMRYSAPVGDAHVVACLSFNRPGDGAGPFGARDRMILHLAHIEMSWVYESDVLMATHGAANLSPRQRQTLEYLLAGHSEKQIAAKMRLSPNTVHHHIKALHRYFGVSSRSELLAKWVK